MIPCGPIEHGGPIWHRLATPGADLMWFRLGGRMRDGTYVYRLGLEPGDAYCRLIWCFNGKPWVCAACGLTISAQRHRPEPSPIVSDPLP